MARMKEFNHQGTKARSQSNDRKSLANDGARMPRKPARCGIVSWREEISPISFPPCVFVPSWLSRRRTIGGGG